VGKSEGRVRRRWKDNIKMYLQEVGRGAWTGSIWFRWKTFFKCGNEFSFSIKCGKFLD
jgi:hypothetical protein